MKFFPFQLHLRDRLGVWLVTNRLSVFLFKKNLSVFFNRAVTRTIIKYYDGYLGHQANPVTGNLGYGFIHYALIVNTKPKRVLCIGSRKGFIPAICALACRENGFGRVDFVDAGYDRKDKNNWSGIGWWKSADSTRHFAFLGLNQWLTAHIMTTELFAKSFPKQRYEYIYVDGDHSYEGAKQDWILFWPRLTRGGFMVFHDVAVRHTKELGAFGVWRLWKQLSKKHAITLPFPAESGLGVLQKT